MVASPSLPRQMPEKLTTAPISVRALVSAAISRAMSKTASWMRMVAAVIGSSRDSLQNGSAAGHRREKRNLAGAGNDGVRLDMGVVDRGANHPRCFEGVGVGLAALGQPPDQIVDGAHARRRLQRFLRLADPFAHPGEILDLH